MKPHLIALIAVMTCALWLSPHRSEAQQPLTIKPLAEKKVADLPPGQLFWRIENFPTAAEARTAAGPWALVAESAGKAWLFTLGPTGGSTAGGTKVVEVGPIPRVAASQYLLRINEASGPPGSVTAIHTHPGSEAFYVLTGEQSIRSAQGVLRIRPGQPEAGNGADSPMEVSSSGQENLLSLVMFVVDASRPFSHPAKLP